MNDEELLDLLTELEGYEDSMEMLEERIHDGCQPAICTTPGCEYTTEMEPDQDEGWCEECHRNTVKSMSVLAGII